MPHAHRTPHTALTRLHFTLYQEILEPIPAWPPILIAAAILIGLAIIWVLATRVYRSKRGIELLLDNEPKPIEGGRGSVLKPTRAGRIVSLDCFRGICITIMVFVNYGGGGYWFFNHSLWYGLTVADLVFPWFIFIMGTAMALSFSVMEQRGNLRSGATVWRVLRRSMILFALGLFINNGFDLPNWRIPGVLQRFAISYLFVSLIIMYVPRIRRFVPNPIQIQGSFAQPVAPLQDLLQYAAQWVVALSLVVVFLCLTYLLDVPGCGRGYTGPGGLQDDSRFLNCTGGAAGYIDRVVLGENHIYQSPTCNELYQTGAYDPEGILGCLTSIFLCFLGLQIGRVLVAYKSHWERLKRFAIYGLVFGSIGTLLCEAQEFSGWMPLSKNLWSLSFVLCMAGTGCLMLAVCYIVVDVFQIWNGAPFIYVGMNSIVIYVGSETLQPYFPFSYQVAQLHSHILATNLIGVAAWHLIAYKFYYERLFINI